MKKLLFVLASLSICLLGSCDKEDEITYKAISVDFAVSQSGMEGNSAEIGLKLSRATDKNLDVTVKMSSTDVQASDLVFTPALDGDQLVVTVPAGSATGSFTVTKAEGKNPQGTIKFQIQSLSLTDGYEIGTVKETTLTLAEIVSEGNTMTLEGKVGDQTYANMVYVDLSNNSQLQIDRKSWNLGFYCGNDNRVILNSSYATVATASDKTDFAAVTLEDAQNAPNLGAAAMSEDFKSEWIDDVTGDLSKTAFGDIATDEAQSKVFFVASEDNKTNEDGTENRSLWYKVKVTATGNGYKVEYGTVEETTPHVVEIAKDPAYNFVGLSLESGKQTPAQAEAGKWDIMWAYAASATAMGTGITVVSFTQDVITSNSVSGVETAIVMTETKSYDDFKLSDVASAEFQTTANVIGTGWRSPVMPGSENGGVKSDRFYVIKDCGGNYYKLQFLKFGSGDTGERGRPELRYELLK